MNKSEAAALVALAAANFPNMQEKDLRPTVQVWMQLLADIPYETAKQAVMKHIMTEKYFPTVTEIRRQVETLTRKERVLSAEEAWIEVMLKIKNGTPGYSSTLVKQAVEAVGGINTIGYTDMSEIGVVRAHFMRVYETLQRRKKEEQELTVFRDLLEQQSGVKQVKG